MSVGMSSGQQLLGELSYNIVNFVITGGRRVVAAWILAWTWRQGGGCSDAFTFALWSSSRLSDSLEHPQPFCIVGLTNEGVCQVLNKFGKGEKRQSPMV